jgi:hypothetical protein
MPSWSRVVPPRSVSWNSDAGRNAVRFVRGDPVGRGFTITVEPSRPG